VVGRTVEGVGLVVLVVGAADVGAVDGAALGELLLHAASASAAPIIPNRSFRIEARVGAAAAYASSP